MKFKLTNGMKASDIKFELMMSRIDLKDPNSLAEATVYGYMKKSKGYSGEPMIYVEGRWIDYGDGGHILDHGKVDKFIPVELFMKRFGHYQVEIVEIENDTPVVKEKLQVVELEECA